jgi:beta-barrel assembly-enhancing protease
MTFCPSRALVAIGALSVTLAARDAEAARVARKPGGKSGAGTLVTRPAGAAKRTGKRQVRTLRPLRSKIARKPVAKKKPVVRVTRKKTAARRSAVAANAASASGIDTSTAGLAPLSIVQGFFTSVASPAEALIAQLTTAMVKYGLKRKEHNPFTSEVQTVAMSQVDEVALGAHIVRQVVPTLGVPLSGRPMERYLDGIVQRLVRASGIDRMTPYRFKVHLVHSDTPNAFAAPGGRIVVTTALLAGMKSEASIAGILAHEIGHVVARHGSQNLARSELVQEILTSLGVAAGTDLRAQRAVLQGAHQLKQEMLSFSRDQEHQSDALGVRILARAGYSARGVEEMADFLGAIDGGLALDDSGSDHPSPVARRENLFATARQSGMTYDADHGADRFALNVTVPLSLGIF